MVLVSGFPGTRQNSVHLHAVSFNRAANLPTSRSNLCNTMPCVTRLAFDVPDYHWRELPLVSLLSRQKTNTHTNKIVATNKHTFSRQKTCFVATNTCFVATKVCLSRQNFCHDKRQTTFCRHKNILLRQTSFSRQNFLEEEEADFCRDKRQTRVCRDKNYTCGGSRQ